MQQNHMLAVWDEEPKEQKKVSGKWVGTAAGQGAGVERKDSKINEISEPIFLNICSCQAIG